MALGTVSRGGGIIRVQTTDGAALLAYVSPRLLSDSSAAITVLCKGHLVGSADGLMDYAQALYCKDVDVQGPPFVEGATELTDTSYMTHIASLEAEDWPGVTFGVVDNKMSVYVTGATAKTIQWEIDIKTMPANLAA